MLNMTSSYCIGTGGVVILPAVTIGYITIMYICLKGLNYCGFTTKLIDTRMYVLQMY